MSAQPSAPVTAVRYPIHQRTLSNGLRVIVSPDHGAPVVAVNIWYDVGSRHEAPGRTGFAHLFEHVMFQGSAHVPSGDHIGLVQAAGGSVNATTWFDRTNYFEAVPTGALDLALWLEADRMASLLDALTQQNLDTQREVVKEEKRQRYDNVPYGDAMERLVSLTFPADHPYGHTTIGAMADLDAAALADVHTFFATHYMPNNAVLSLVGDVEPEVGFAKAEEYFGPVAAQTPPPQLTTAPLPPISGHPRDELNGDVPADAVYLSWRLPAVSDAEFDAVDLGLGILGEGQTARLHRKLVREDEIAEAASAYSMGLIGGNSFGLAYARARDGMDISACESALLAEIRRLGEHGPDQADLHRAKAQYERQWLQALAAVDDRADQFSAMATLFGDPDRVNTRLAEVMAVTADQVRDACARWLHPDNRATLVYRSTDPDLPPETTSDPDHLNPGKEPA